MPLSLLSEQLRARLRSGVAVTCMAQCVGELVDNAIDAGAKCIAVRVDVSKYRIQVIDNGVGVARQDLDLIGQRYATSKCHSLADLDHSLQHLGYRGEALASTIDCSGTVEITSRHHLSQQTYSKLFFHGSPTSVTHSSNQRPSVGTTITVHDFFYNLPVRRKAMSANLEMETVRRTLQGVALSNPSISFSLRDDQSGECVLQTRRTNSTLGSFSILFGSGKASGMKEVCLKHTLCDLSGYISIDSHYSKALQFVYVNKRLVKKTRLHSCVNNLMANSLVCRKLSRQGDSKWQNLESDILSPRRTSDKHAMYVLMISCSRQEYDVCLEPAKTLIEFRNWDTILECLAQVVRGFLVEHNLTLGADFKEQEDMDKSSDSEVLSENEEEGSLPSSLSKSHGFGADVNVEQDNDLVGVEYGKETSNASLHLCDDDGKSCEPCRKEANAVLRCHQDTTVMGSARECKRASVLHLNRPTRSPLNSGSRSSKLAGLLRNGQKKTLLHSALALKTTERTSDHTNLATSNSLHPFIPRVLPLMVSSGSELYTPDPACCAQLSSLQAHAPILQSDCQVSVPSLRDCPIDVSNGLIVTPIATAALPFVSSLEGLSGTAITHPMVHSVENNLTNSAAANPFISSTSDWTSTAAANPFVSSSDLTNTATANPFIGNTRVELDLTSTAPFVSSANQEGDLTNTAGTTTNNPFINGVSLTCTTVTPNDPKAGYNFNVHNSTVTIDESHYNFDASQDSIAGASDCQQNSISETVIYPNSSRMLQTEPLRVNSEGSCVRHACREKELKAGKSGVNKVRSVWPIWKESTDPLTACKIYIHSKTGNTCSRPPDREHESNLTTCDLNPMVTCSGSSEGMFSVSYGAQPITAAPHLSHDFQHFLPGCKRLRVDDRVTASTGQLVDCVISGGDEEEGENMKESETREDGSFANLLRNWTNPAFLPGQVDILNAGKGCIKVHNIINEYKFTREMLNSIKVLGQVDKKFIACILDTKSTGEHDLLVLFDQHAAHERVRLEALQADLYEISDDSSVQPPIKSSKVCPPLLISLTATEKKLVKTFKKQFEMLGVSLVQDESGCIAVASLPLVFMSREASEVRRGRPAVALDLVQDMVIKHLEVLQATSGGSSALPLSLTNVLNSQACHSAIKFGDSLTKDKCCELIQSLSKCKLPFQCAHGRPSLVPVLDLSILKKKQSPKAGPSDLCRKLSAKITKHHSLIT